MAPYYEYDIDRRGRVDPESEKRLNPGDKVTLGRISGGKGEGYRYSVSVEIKTDNNARVEVFDRDTPAEVGGFTREEDREVVIYPEEHLDGSIRTYTVWEKGVCVEGHIGVDLDPKPRKIIEWREDPRVLEEWRRNHPVSSPLLEINGKIFSWIEKEWERSRLLGGGEFIVSLPVTFGVMATVSFSYPLESITVLPVRWLAKRLRGREK